MNSQPIISSSHAFYLIRLHIVFVTKYRRKILTPEIRKFLEHSFRGVLKSWKCSLEEFGGEDDHVHLLIGIHPALDISRLINNLKSASSRTVRSHFKEHVDKFYWKPYFWHLAYYVGSVGVVSLDTIKNYIENQGVQEKGKSLARPTS